MSEAIVVDASVVLAILRDEPLGKFDAGRIGESVISAVNLAEVLTKLIALGMPEGEAAAAVRQLDMGVVPFDEGAARLTAALVPLTRRAGLSLGDRACIALGLSLEATIVTADRAWKNLDLGGKFVVIR